MATNHAVLRIVSLVSLTLQNCTLGLVMTRSREPNANGKRYNAATAVFLVELGKMVISFCILFVQQIQIVNATRRREKENLTLSTPSPSPSSSDQQESKVSTIHDTLRRIHSEIFTRDGLQMIVPATLYVVQNNLLLLAANDLSSTSFQIFSQFKIVTTAIFTVLYLKRHLVLYRWISIIVLTLGVMLFQASLSSSSKVEKEDQPPTTTLSNTATSPSSSSTNGTLGFILMIVACLISGFAGTFIEKVLKQSKNSIWANNFQICFFSLIPASLPILYQFIVTFFTATQSTTHHFSPFDAFNGWAWSVVFLNILGGLLVSLVVKYADSILKAFAASVAVILTFLFTYLFIGTTFTLPSLLGATMVIGAVVAYNYIDGNPIQQSNSPIAGQYEAVPLDDREDPYDEEEMTNITPSSPHTRLSPPPLQHFITTPETTKD